MWTPSSTRWMTPCPASGLLNFSITAAVSEKQRGTSEPENGPRACFGLQRSRSTLVGVQWLVEGTRAFLRRRRPGAGKRKLHQHLWVHGLPFKMRFRRSKLYISALLPLGLGFFIGILSAIMGVGGGFVMVPAMIYMLGMPTAVVPGTSLFQIIFVAASVTILQAINNRTVDVMLAILLLVGGVIGAQVGSRMGSRLRGEQLRIMLALLVLAVAGKLAFDMTATPDNLYSVVFTK